MASTRRLILAGGIAVAGGLVPLAAQASDRAGLTADGLAALHKLEASEPRARRLARRARAVLVFPKILKAGLVFGGQTSGIALFFMPQSSLSYLRKSAGFSVGSGPSIVVLKQGAGAEVDSTTVTQDVYAIPFNQKGLMADLTLQGTKITRIHPD